MYYKDQIEINSYFLTIKLKKKYFIGIKLDKFIFFKDKMKKNILQEQN